MTKSTKFIAAITVILGVALLWFFTNPYLIINDTPERIEGSLYGGSSPGRSIDLESGKFVFLNQSYLLGDFWLLKDEPQRTVVPTFNLGLLKVIFISKLPIDDRGTDFNATAQGMLESFKKTFLDGIGPVAIDDGVSVETKTYTNSVPRYKFTTKIEYPLVHGLGGAVEADLNQKVLSMLKDLEVSKLNDQERDSNRTKRDLIIGFQTITVTKKIVSIHFYVNEVFPDAIHPLKYRFTYNYDPGTQREIVLADLFKSGSNYLETLSQNSLAYLAFNSGVDNDEITKKALSPQPEHFSNFFIVPDGLIFLFDIFGAGPAVVPLTWSDLGADLIRKF